MNFGKAILEMQFDVAMKWSATAVLIVATALNSLGYYPTGPILYLVGGLMWLSVSIMWREWSLIVTNAVLAGVNATGLIIKHFF
jgi:hypothetical protein